jgi:hypothetical protein
MMLNKPTWSKEKREWIAELVADIPWGILAFVTIAVLMVTHRIQRQGLDNVRALLPAGLLGVGHAIHTGSKHLRR